MIHPQVLTLNKQSCLLHVDNEALSTIDLVGSAGRMADALTGVLLRRIKGGKEGYRSQLVPFSPVA